MMRGVGGVTRSIHQSGLAKGLGLGFSGSSARDSVGRGQHSSNRVGGISTRTIQQLRTPSLSQLFDQDWYPDSSSPSLSSSPCSL